MSMLVLQVFLRSKLMKKQRFLLKQLQTLPLIKSKTAQVFLGTKLMVKK